MRIAYLGAGTWGVCLASLLASKGHQVRLWSIDHDFADYLGKRREHPKLPHFRLHEGVEVTTDLAYALDGAELVVESVTAMGVRPVLEQVLACGGIRVPFVITSKGIEQNSCLLLPEVALQVLGEGWRDKLACLSGPSHAEEVSLSLPTSLVCASGSAELMQFIADLFTTSYLRVYPNSDIVGVAFGGAMKNIIAIACGISDGLGFGDNAKAALMTRGLHEMRKLASSKGCRTETLSGLAGLGDLCVTCLSKHSRNYSFGRLIAEGLDLENAKERIGMVVEGAYTCVSALQLGEKAEIDLPITRAVHTILYGKLEPRVAVRTLFQRTVKEEHL